MKQINVRLIEQGDHYGYTVPINIALVDAQDIEDAEITRVGAVARIAEVIHGPVGINVFDLNAVTTTSDGVVIEGAIVKMAAGDMGKVHKEFGMLPMAEIEVNTRMISEEAHLSQIEQLYSGRRLFRGPNPANKHVPVHNAVMTGRAVNNNSATEMMNVVTMDEILLPILGQLQIMHDRDVMLGPTGEHISVGIGMTVAEKYGRVFPHRQFQAGDTAHDSGQFAKHLKDHIPCILAPKKVLARYIVQALRTGMVPGEHLGCSPAVLACAKALNCPIAMDKITPRARVELESVGIDEAWFQSPSPKLRDSELIDKADEVIPGAENCKQIAASDIMQKIQVKV
ncbi:MAG: hypothetical protein ACLFUS_08145 [Candidatus Sumerlaeia bacterium]